MRTVLYLISKSPKSWPDYQFVLTPGSHEDRKVVVFLRDNGDRKQFHADQIFYLEDKEDPSLEKTPRFSESISYRDLLNLIFSSESSVVL